jgi:hypothetical protein
VRQHPRAIEHAGDVHHGLFELPLAYSQLPARDSARVVGLGTKY